jgi:hypothetical protein
MPLLYPLPGCGDLSCCCKLCMVAGHMFAI